MGGSARASNTSLRVRGAPRGPLCCSRRRPAYKRQTLTGGGRTATAVPCRGPTAAQASAAQSCRAVHGSSMAWRTTAARVRVFIDAFIDAIRTCAAPRARAQCSHTCTHMHRHTHTQRCRTQCSSCTAPCLEHCSLLRRDSHSLKHPLHSRQGHWAPATGRVVPSRLQAP